MYPYTTQPFQLLAIANTRIPILFQILHEMAGKCTKKCYFKSDAV